MTSPLLAGLLTVLLVLAVDTVGRSAAIWVGALGLLVSATVSLWSGLVHDGDWVFGGALAVGGRTAYVAAFLYLLSALFVAGGSKSLIASRSGGQVAALIGFSTVASIVLASSRDLALTVLSLETVALTGYALVASGNRRRSDEASMKYFVQGAIMTGILLYGSAVLFGVYGVGVRYDELAMGVSTAQTAGPILLVLAAMTSAVSFKMSAFPFHSWAPDAFETAPSTPAATLASIPKIAAILMAIVLFGGVFLRHFETWTVMFATVAVASIAFGNLAALKQASYQRMLAYSGIAQAGYAFAGFVALIPSGPTWIKLFAATYALGVAGAFLAADAVRETREDWDGSIEGLAGLASERPLLAAAIGTCLLSLTGIPLTAGFWGKFWVFLTAANAGWEWLAAVGFVGSVISFGYYGAVLRAMYLDSPGNSRATTPATETDGGSPGPATFVTAILALAVLAVGLFPLFTSFTPFVQVLGN